MTGRLIVKVVPCPGSAWTSMVPLRSSTTVRTTSSPTPRPDVWVTSSRVEKPGENSTWSSALPVAALSGSNGAAGDGNLAQPRLVDAATVVTDLDDHGRAGGARRDAHGGLGRLAGLQPSGRRFTAVVDGVGDQVPQRVGDGVEDARVQLDVLAGEHQPDVLGLALARQRQVAHELGEPCEHAVQRNHGEAHRAVADGGESRLGVLGTSQELAPGGAQLVAEGHEAVQRIERLLVDVLVGQRRAGRSGRTLVSGSERGHLATVSADPAYVELGLPHDVEQVVHPSGRDADRVAAQAPLLQVREVLLEEPGYGDGVVTVDGGGQRSEHSSDVVGPHRVRCPGQ